MEVVHPRRAGLDVHKEMVVACVRRTQGAKIDREVRTFETTTSDLVVPLAWLREAEWDPRRHGSHRRVLEAGLEYPERR